MGSESAIAAKEMQGGEKFLVFPQVTSVIIRDNGYDTGGLDVSQPIPINLLKEKGIAMVNVVGGAERTVIQEVGETSFRGKLFLTEADLAVAKRSMVPEEVTDEALLAISEDMLRFIDECYWFRSYYSLFDEDFLHTYVNIARATLDQLGKDQRKPWWKISKRSGQINWLGFNREAQIVEGVIQTYQAKHQAPTNVRGIPVADIEFRGEGEQLYGSKCPLIDCDHFFSSRNGIKILDREEKITGEKIRVRLNEIVAHLASHGICNTGEPTDWDQRYLTLREYMNLYRRRGEVTGLGDVNLDGLLKEIALESTRKIVTEVGIVCQEEQLLKAFKERGLTTLFWQ